MSATAAAVQRYRLVLPSTRKTCRELDIDLQRNQLSVLLALPNRPMTTGAFSSEAIVHCRLNVKQSKSMVLWVGTAAFDVNDAEAEMIVAHFERHGLKVER